MKNQYLAQAKAPIRQALRKVSNEKLAQLLAWAQDGKMRYTDPAACLEGTLNTPEGVPLHTSYDCSQYCNGSVRVLHVKDASLPVAFHGLHVPFNFAVMSLADWHDSGKRRIVAILKAQLRIRERIAKQQPACTRSTDGVLHCECDTCLSLRHEWANDGAEDMAEATRWTY
jgi:hypothetical protein